MGVALLSLVSRMNWCEMEDLRLCPAVTEFGRQPPRVNNQDRTGFLLSRASQSQLSCHTTHPSRLHSRARASKKR